MNLITTPTEEEMKMKSALLAALEIKLLGF